MLMYPNPNNRLLKCKGGGKGGGGSCGAVPERFRCGSSAVRKGGAGRSSVSGEEGAGAGGRGRGTVGGE